MIYFFVTYEHAYTMRAFAESWHDRLDNPIEIMPYNELIRMRQLKPGTYIFADIERLTAGQTKMLGLIWEQLARQVPPQNLLNHPARSMARYPLLRHAFNQGINRFNAYRVSETTVPEQFPVFVREASRHNGTLTPLLNSQEELDQALAQLPKKKAFRSDLIITEFCDTSDDDGLYRKYSAFRVGDSIIPRHLFFSKKWVMKHSDLTEASMMAEERTYLQTNPHAEQLRSFFDSVDIQYGRIDYGLLNGRIQVWEINTNPMIVSTHSMECEVRRDHHEIFLTGMLKVLNDTTNQSGPLARPAVSLRLPAGFAILYELKKCRKLGFKYFRKRTKNLTKQAVKTALRMS
jgi:hypothetical protein